MPLRERSPQDVVPAPMSSRARRSGAPPGRCRKLADVKARARARCGEISALHHVQHVAQRRLVGVTACRSSQASVRQALGGDRCPSVAVETIGDAVHVQEHAPSRSTCLRAAAITADVVRVATRPSNSSRPRRCWTSTGRKATASTTFPLPCRRPLGLPTASRTACSASCSSNTVALLGRATGTTPIPAPAPPPA